MFGIVDWNRRHVINKMWSMQSFVRCMAVGQLSLEGLEVCFTDCAPGAGGDVDDCCCMSDKLSIVF